MQKTTKSTNVFLDILESLSEKSLKRPLSLQEVVDSFGIRSHSLIIIFLSLPFLQPIPLIGLSTPLGAMIVIVSFFKILKRNPWIPKTWQKKEISSGLLVKIFDMAKKYFSRIKNLISRRWTFYFESVAFEIFNFIIIAVLALMLSLPLPVPFSNTIPALAIFINGVGQLEEDGVLISISYLIFVIALCFFSALGAGAIAGASAVMK